MDLSSTLQVPSTVSFPLYSLWKSGTLKVESQMPGRWGINAANALS
jgi:hypothetical protein